LPEKWKVNQIHNLMTIEKFLNINKQSYIEIIIFTSKILGYYSLLLWNSMTIAVSNWTKCICEIKMGVSHQKGEIPGNDLSANSDRIVSGVWEERSFDGNRFAVVLVGPAGVVAVTTNRKFQISVERRGVRFAVILNVKWKKEWVSDIIPIISTISSVMEGCVKPTSLVNDKVNHSCLDIVHSLHAT
jgi:hypothetical protein